MYKVILTDNREALVDADSFSFIQGSMKLFKDDSVVAFFDSDYVIGVYQTDPPYLFIRNEKIWKKEEDE